MKFTALLFASVVLFLLIMSDQHHPPVLASSPTLEIDERVRQRILAATLQIGMYEYAADDAATRTGGQGLGTLVAYGGQTFILTHNHWSFLTPNLHEVELRDATGALLMVLDAASFEQLITYHDGGTMLLKAPTELGDVVPAPLAATGVIKSAKTLWLARRSAADSGNAVEVIPARVEAVEAVGIPARLRLRALNGEVLLPGDSGGGVWLGEQLVGNIWASGLQIDNRFWTRLLGAQQERATDLIIAARQPLSEFNPDYPITAMAGELDDRDIERGPHRPER